MRRLTVHMRARDVVVIYRPPLKVAGRETYQDSCRQLYTPGFRQLTKFMSSPLSFRLRYRGWPDNILLLQPGDDILSTVVGRHLVEQLCFSGQPVQLTIASSGQLHKASGVKIKRTCMVLRTFRAVHNFLHWELMIILVRSSITTANA